MSYDIIGNIAIMKFDKEDKKKKLEIARKLLEERPSITSVLEKVERVKGKLRTIKTRLIQGKKTKEALYNENGCRFKLNVDRCYFSPRLANERLEIANRCRLQDRVLVLFAGVAPFSIIIAKKSHCNVVSVELGKECSKYARENVRLNKLDNKVKVIQGDVRKLDKLIEGKYDKIIMPRPQLKDSFLEYVWKFVKKGTEIYYYDFGKDLEEILNKIEKEMKKADRKVKVIGFKKAGEIAPFKYRWRIDMAVVK